MRIDERTIGDVAVLMVHGDIVLNAAGPVLADRIRALLDQNRRRIVLDLTCVRYVDSSGLGELVESFSAARNRGGAVKLIGVTRRLRDLLIITKLLNVFERFDTQQDAVASFSRRAVAR
jgi:anti-sigma B factor antagonist